MSKQETFVRLLLVGDSPEEAENTVSILRNAGIAARPLRIETMPQLKDILAAQQVDLILANTKAAATPTAQIVAAAYQSGKDIPVIATMAVGGDDPVVQAYRDGASAVAIRGRSEHLILVVKREFETLSLRRAVRRLEANLKESERRCEALLDSSKDPICFIHEGAHVRANKAYLEMFEFEELSDIEGVSIIDMIAPSYSEGFKNLLRKVSKGEPPPPHLELRARTSNGREFPAMMEFASATFEGEPCLQITFRSKASSVDGAELEKLKTQDLVTGLSNRVHLLNELDRTVTEAAEGRDDHSFLLIEADNFRSVLESIGLGSADSLLAEMANELRAAADSDDIAARFSDTSFVILIRRNTHAEALKRAQALCKAFEKHLFEIGARSLNLTVSVGLVMIGEKIANADSILGHASSSLRAAQVAGGNRVEIYDPAAQDKADVEAEKQRLSDIQHALKHNGFVLYFQPIVSLQGAEGEFYEILLRMIDPRGGPEIMPAGFFPVAEKNNLLSTIDRWVIASAIRALSEREKAGHRTTFFVKLSPRSLEDATILPWIAQHLKAQRVRGDALVFEMPESKVVTNMKPVQQFTLGLKQLHSSFALEQFGSGLNSFQVLTHVDASYLKIDRGFMQDLPKNKDNQNKIREICQQAKVVGKTTIAEFVEDAASMSLLFTMGVDFVQGNFLQEPEKVMAYDFAG